MPDAFEAPEAGVAEELALVLVLENACTASTLMDGDFAADDDAACEILEEERAYTGADVVVVVACACAVAEDVVDAEDVGDADEVDPVLDVDAAKDAVVDVDEEAVVAFAKSDELYDDAAAEADEGAAARKLDRAL